MNMRNTLRGALRRFPPFSIPHPFRSVAKGGASDSSSSLAAAVEPARKTVPLPTIFTPGAPTLTGASKSGFSTNWGGLVRAGVMPKPTPGNLRRFAEMPIARKALNTIKDRIAGMQWRIQPRHGRATTPSRANSLVTGTPAP